MVTEESEKIEQLVNKYAGKEGVLIQALLDVQREFNYLPGPVLKRMSERMGIPLSYIYRVATFYKAMSLTPRGKHLVDVCLGTACHVRGAPRILRRVKKDIGVTEESDTSEDLKYTLRTVRCLGCCAMGPMIVVDGRYHANVSAERASRVLSRYD